MNSQVPDGTKVPAIGRRRGFIWNVALPGGLVRLEIIMTRTSDHGIASVRGEDHPADKERAQLAQKIELGHKPVQVEEEADDRD
jgi:hypothetical protein